MVEGGEMHQTAAVGLQAARKMLPIEAQSSCECYRGTGKPGLSRVLYLHTFQGLKCPSWAVGIKESEAG